VQQQLPAVNTLEAYSSASQVGVAQLAVQYCQQVMATASIQATVFPGVTFSGSTYSSVTANGTDAAGNTQYTASGQAAQVIADLAALSVGNGTLTHQPALSTVTTELTNLVGTLCGGSTPCNGSATRVSSVTVGACAAALGNADVMID
jgi:hypothetical protein